MSDTSMTEAEKQEWELKLRKLDAEIAELTARTAKQLRENTYYPLVVGSGATLAIVGLVKLFFTG